MEFKYEYHIYFFPHLKYPNRYYIREFRDDIAQEFYKKIRHIYDWAAGCGYALLEVGPPFVAIEMPDLNLRRRFRPFLKEQICRKVSDENQYIAEWVGVHGWFEVDEINPEKWLLDFHDFLNRKKENPAIKERKGAQMSLF